MKIKQDGVEGVLIITCPFLEPKETPPSMTFSDVPSFSQINGSGKFPRLKTCQNNISLVFQIKKQYI